MGGLMNSWPPRRGHALSSVHHHLPAVPVPHPYSPCNRQRESPDEILICSQLPPQTQEIEMMQLASKQVKQQLHKQGIVQAQFCSCPLTWRLHDDSHWQHSAVYLNRKNFSILKIVCTSNQ